jgi:PhzF family phenazine biosynthesis protein
MSGRYRVYQIDAFTNAPFAGNPAGVVPAASGLSDVAMQAIARELNTSETAFVLPPRADDHDVHVRFFTPTTEVPICGHATVAAHWVRGLEGAPAGVTRQLTGAGVLPVEIEHQADGGRRIWMTQRPATFEPPLADDLRAALIAALGVRPEDLVEGAPVQVVSTGHAKVMICLRDRQVLDGLSPDLPALARLSAEIGSNGYYTFTLNAPAPGMLAHGRMFAPAIGIAEDPVTGNASGPLGAWLLRHGLLRLDGDGRRTFQVRQGEAMGRPGVVTVEVSRPAPDDETIAVRIAGTAVMVFQTEIEVAA